MDLDSLIKDISEIAKDQLKKYGDEIKNVISEFYESTKDDIKRYTKALADTEISKEEYVSLLRQKQQLISVALLTESVKKKVRLKELQDDVIGFLVDKIFDAV